MTTAASNLTLGLLQFNPGREVAADLETACRLAAQLPERCDLVVLPENCLCLGNHATVAAAAREREAWLELLRPVVRELRCAAVFGGVPVKVAPGSPGPGNGGGSERGSRVRSPSRGIVATAAPRLSPKDAGGGSGGTPDGRGGSGRLGGRCRLEQRGVWGGSSPPQRGSRGGAPVGFGTAGAVRNCALVLGADGGLLADYAKIHLFQLNPGKPGGVDETALYTHGTEPVVFELKGWRIGLSICYDLRFPELYRAYAPADLVLCTAAFTRQTGAAHWHTLLRARAIENQCFMAAAAVCGANPDTGLELYGHSLACDPWGTVLAEASETEPAALVVRLEQARVAEVRARLPALAQRRLQ